MIVAAAHTPRKAVPAAALKPRSHGMTSERKALIASLGLRNEGIEEALMCAIIGNPKPVTPTYPEDHPVAKIKRTKA